MKSFLSPSRALLAASLLVLSTSPVLAADAKTESLKNAQDELAILKNKYTDTHPQVIEQKQRIAQLQRHIDEENPTATSVTPAIIRTELKVQQRTPGGKTETKITPTLVTQAAQEARITTGNFSVKLTSATDEQNNITSSVEISRDFPVNTPEHGLYPPVKFPAVKSRSGQLVSVQAGDLIVEILAALVEPKGISVDFPGGTLAQLLTAISNSGSQPFNLIASKEALSLPLPQFSLRNVGPRDLALALDQLLVGYVVDFPTDKAERDGLSVFTLRSNQSSTTAQVEPPQNERFASYPLGAVLQNKIQVNDVIDTINTAWLLDPSHLPEGLKLKYHAATGILLVSSRYQSGLDIAHNIIANLSQQAEFLRTNPQPKP